MEATRISRFIDFVLASILIFLLPTAFPSIGTILLADISTVLPHPDSVSETSSVPVTTGLVGYWAGEGNADDSSGFDNHGTLIGDATFGPGRFGLAFQFTGGGAMRAAADDLPTGSADRTLAFWTYSDDYAVGNDFLAGWGDTNSNEMSSIILGWFNNPDRKPTFWGYQNDLQSPLTLTDGQWHHMAFTLDGTSATLYIDGLQAGTGSITGLNTPAGTQFRLGDTLGPMTNFSGMLDEIAVYDRALTPEEVYRLANDEVFADAFDLEP
jgi:hypothetical protein